jgi:hypothetical protein
MYPSGYMQDIHHDIHQDTCPDNNQPPKLDNNPPPQPWSPRAKEWYDARVTEINKLKSSGAVESVRLDDPRVLDYLANGEQVINTMMIGNVKRDDKHNEIRLNNRCVVLGNEMTSVSDNEKTSPTVRCEGVKCCEANKVLRGQDEICFDYKGAYLQGIPRRLLIVRPPAGHREVDEDGTGMLWLLHAPLLYTGKRTLA